LTAFAPCTKRSTARDFIWVVLQAVLQERTSRQPDAKNSRDLTEIRQKHRTIQTINTTHEWLRFGDHTWERERHAVTQVDRTARQPVTLLLWSFTSNHAAANLSILRVSDCAMRVRLTETATLAQVLLVLSYDSRHPGSWVPSVGSSFRTHALFHGHSDSDGTVVLQETRSLSLLLTCHELFLYWMSSLTRSPNLEPITRNRARRPVARDLNDRSLMQQLLWIFRRPFLTFLNPSHGFLPLSGLHCPAWNSISSSRPLEDSSSWQPRGSTAAANWER